jgi:hypothetical protein
MLGRANSRLKDFYDIWILNRTYDFSADRLARVIADRENSSLFEM